ncbi:MAG: hypothetical protein ACI840_000290 [Ulvibacter sp.]|jgi:hypothetical protein
MMKVLHSLKNEISTSPKLQTNRASLTIVESIINEDIKYQSKLNLEGNILNNAIFILKVFFIWRKNKHSNHSRLIILILFNEILILLKLMKLILQVL